MRLHLLESSAYGFPWLRGSLALPDEECDALMSEGEQITLADIPERLREAPDAVAQVLASGDLSIKRAARVIEDALIRRALEQTGGNRTAASRLLQISHRALLYKIKDYGVR